eukprot:TRINITY_DN9824_c0_g1_i3.p1 TRINITY_DN9824_c0_g1~~TRINITY_DN9824_c0_g1_i3.p1  ORF type:complete len:606 (-),score=115.20 TRINITY_DN9824_c0_g1_i3:652-2469(-)
MVEGHQCHRLAFAHRKILVGNSFQASSPNNRFTEGAAAIDGFCLDKIEVHGKNLFYFFGDTVVHIHFGMSGSFNTVKLQHEPEARDTTRLVLRNEDIDIVALLSAMTVQYGSIHDLYDKKIKQLGPDPLREDADPQRFWDKIKKSKKPIGQLLMDQNCIAGLGNIYRAEVLFKTGIHPEQPGTTVTQQMYHKLWKESVWCLQRGFKVGSILTVDPHEKLGKPWTRRYIYNQKKCGRCGSDISRWDMATRKVYACLTCQPLYEVELEEGRKKALADAGVPILFSSKCAPEAEEDILPEQMTVAQLKQKLSQAGQCLYGNRELLIERLQILNELNNSDDKTGQEQKKDVKEENDLSDAENDDLGVDMNMLENAPGIKHLGDIKSAQEAALEKEQAGENRAVEHVALIVDEQIPSQPVNNKNPPTSSKRTNKRKKQELNDDKEKDIDTVAKGTKVSKKEQPGDKNGERTSKNSSNNRRKKVRGLSGAVAPDISKALGFVDPESCLSGDLYGSDEGTIYDVMLLKQNRTSENYYIIQLVKNDKANEYNIYSRWGRVGAAGQCQVQHTDGQQEALDIFEDKFQDKTGIEWSSRYTQLPRVGFYQWIQSTT